MGPRAELAIYSRARCSFLYIPWNLDVTTGTNLFPSKHGIARSVGEHSLPNVLRGLQASKEPFPSEELNNAYKSNEE